MSVPQSLKMVKSSGKDKPSVTFKQLIPAIPALQELSQRDLPWDIALSLARLIRSSKAEIDLYNQEYQKLIGKFRDPDAADVPEGQVRITNPTAFAKELDLLQSQPVKIEVIRIPLEQLRGALPQPIKPMTIAQLDWLVDL